MMDLLGLLPAGFAVLVGGFVMFLVFSLPRSLLERAPERPHFTFLIISALAVGFLVVFAIELFSGRLGQVEARSFAGLAVFYLGCAAGYAAALRLPIGSPQPEARFQGSVALARLSSQMDAMTSEMDAMLKERTRLKSEGKLDAAASLRIEARLQELSIRTDKEFADLEVEIDGKRYRPLPKPLQVLLWTVMALLAIGTLLEMLVGDSFIFSGKYEYRDAAPWLLALLTPILALGMFFHFRAMPPIGMAATALSRWSVFCAGVAIVAWMVVMAPLGWIALYGWMVGERSVGMEARVIAIETPHKRRRTCDQHAELEFRGVSARVCVARRISGQHRAGETVRVSGLLSRLGLYVERIDPK